MDAQTILPENLSLKCCDSKNPRVISGISRGFTIELCASQHVHLFIARCSVLKMSRHIQQFDRCANHKERYMCAKKKKYNNCHTNIEMHKERNPCAQKKKKIQQLSHKYCKSQRKKSMCAKKKNTTTVTLRQELDTDCVTGR